MGLADRKGNGSVGKWMARRGERYLLWRSPRNRGTLLGGTCSRFREGLWQVCAEAAALMQLIELMASLVA